MTETFPWIPVSSRFEFIAGPPLLLGKEGRLISLSSETMMAKVEVVMSDGTFEYNVPFTMLREIDKDVRAN